jgi:hypothetical protein
MKYNNTSCKNCLFSHEASSDSTCEFNIIDHIKENKTITIKDNFFHIENYLCQYGMSREIYEKNKDELEKQNIDIKEQIKKNAYIKYYLVHCIGLIFLIFVKKISFFYPELACYYYYQ